MHWKLKALTQRVVAALPSRASYATYYWLQRRLGTIQRTDPAYGFFVAIEAWKRLKALGYDPVGKTFFEVGTGRVPIVPIAFHLLGAGPITTLDLNPYLRPEMLDAVLRYLAANRDKVNTQFGPLVDGARLAALVDYARTATFDAPAALRLCGITHVAPGDATCSGLASESIDIHTSNTTLEHIPPPVLVKIFKEGDRVLGPQGLFVHRIDYSDHFAHADRSISPINFLRYPTRQWRRYADNRYMYMNRLRHDDFIELFSSNQRRILLDEPDVSAPVLAALRTGEFTVDAQFRGKRDETLATTGAWIVATRGGG
jgi:SAM-dependent methyltransferase